MEIADLVVIVLYFGGVTACGLYFARRNRSTEEYFLGDGRLVLWRRYNGEKWSERDPERDENARGTYERLAEARAPAIEVFGEQYFLWYDQIPDYAL